MKHRTEELVPSSEILFGSPFERMIQGPHLNSPYTMCFWFRELPAIFLISHSDRSSIHLE